MNIIWHQLGDFTRLIGMRDRLRCPKCRAVGTWKPHGGWIDSMLGDKAPRRWLCKWCGYFVRARTKTSRAFIADTYNVWTMKRDAKTAKKFTTPQRALRDYFSKWSKFRKPPNPWYG